MIDLPSLLIITFLISILAVVLLLSDFYEYKAKAKESGIRTKAFVIDKAINKDSDLMIIPMGSTLVTPISTNGKKYSVKLYALKESIEVEVEKSLYDSVEQGDCLDVTIYNNKVVLN